MRKLFFFFFIILKLLKIFLQVIRLFQKYYFGNLQVHGIPHDDTHISNYEYRFLLSQVSDSVRIYAVIWSTGIKVQIR